MRCAYSFTVAFDQVVAEMRKAVERGEADRKRLASELQAYHTNDEARVAELERRLIRQGQVTVARARIATTSACLCLSLSSSAPSAALFLPRQCELGALRACCCPLIGAPCLGISQTTHDELAARVDDTTTKAQVGAGSRLSTLSTDPCTVGACD